jgi:hypothetical protein
MWSWFSPRLMPIFGGPALIYWPQHKGLRGDLARMIAVMRRFDAACRREKACNAPRVLFPRAPDFFAIGIIRFRRKE